MVPINSQGHRQESFLEWSEREDQDTGLFHISTSYVCVQLQSYSRLNPQSTDWRILSKIMSSIIRKIKSVISKKDGEEGKLCVEESLPLTDRFSKFQLLQRNIVRWYELSRSLYLSLASRQLISWGSLKWNFTDSIASLLSGLGTSSNGM